MPRSRLTYVSSLLLLIATQASGMEWQVASPESHRMDAVRLQALQDDLAQRNTRAILIIRHDAIVWEWYAPGHGKDKPHATASLAKSLVGGMSLLVALNDGLVQADDPAWKYIPAWKTDPKKSKITLRHLATHSSGIEDAFAPETGKSHNQLEGWKGDFWRARSLGNSREPVRNPRNPFTIAIHDAPVLFQPGTDFAYSNPGMAALSQCITASLKDTKQQDIRTLLGERIMKPIGIQAKEWSIGYGRTYEVDGLPVVANWGGGLFTARATARVGRLLLCKGNWEGKQLIEPKWVDELVTYRGTLVCAAAKSRYRPFCS